MECENTFCIYEEDGHCLLDRISLDVSGQCVSCLLVNLPDEELSRRKVAQREAYDAE